MSADGPVAWWHSCPQWLQRVLKATLGVIAFVGVLTVTYHTVMIRFEGASPTLAHSLQVVVETVTGTGYGSDAPWTTPVANGLVVLMDLSTFLVLFVVFPYVFQPVLETALLPSLPATTDADDHVVVCGTPRLTDRLIDDLAGRDIDLVVVTDDESDAIELQDDGLTAIHGAPTSADTLRRAGVDRARAVVVDTGDERAASVVLAAREVDPDVRTVAVVDHLDHKAQLSHAGADSVLTPRHLLGRRIAERVGRQLDPARSDSIDLGEDFALLEMTVTPESRLAGQTVADIETDDITVVGHWVDGEFVGEPDAKAVVDPETVLLLAGPTEPLAELEADSCRVEPDPTVLLAGYGIVGSTVSNELDDAGIECRVIDMTDGPDIDIVGDATAPETLRRAGVADAAAVVIALDDDDATVLSVLAADEASGSPDVIARMNDPTNETNIRRAGAAYVLGVPTISGRLLVSEVLQEPVVGVDRQLRTARIDGVRFAGQSLAATPIADTDCVVVGVERDGTVTTDITGEFQLRPDDQLLVVGPDADIGVVG
ncbi:MAG: TrkA family potassium uptake protein [Halonotius sp.]